MRNNTFVALGLIGLGLVTGCGGSGNSAVTTVPTAHLAVTLPTGTTAEVGTPFTFTVTALDSANAVVQTYVGTVQITTSDTSAMLPANATLARGTGTFTVTFRTAGSQTITAIDTVGNAISGTSAATTVSPSPVVVSISPKSVGLHFGDLLTFSATVAGTSNHAVTWRVLEGAAGGSVTEAGVYTAPQTAGNYHVIATSSADTTISATATVTVAVPATVTITPESVTMVPGGTQTYTATVTGTLNTAVTYSIDQGAAGGSITASGVYTAPQTTGFVTITARSVADTTAAASANVTVWPAGDTTPTGSMHNARGFYTATLLTNGKVLIAGGDSAPNPDSVGGIRDAELYDPSTGTFASTGLMTSPRYSHSATLLPDGKVLVTGGLGDGGNPGGPNSLPPPVLASAELYDPATGEFTATGNMTEPRANHTSTLLPDGRVLIVGGIGDIGISNGTFSYAAPDRVSVVFGLETAELYHPGTGTFSPAASMSTRRFAHATTPLANGKVLITGGISSVSGVLQRGLVNATAELYDPVTDRFGPTAAQMHAPRDLHTATLLSGGTKVLLTGGGEYPGILDGTAQIAELYDSATDSFTSSGYMNSIRIGHTATLLNSGEVLIAGGSTYDCFQRSWCRRFDSQTLELFDPVSGNFAPTATMSAPRAAHTATRLNGGAILLAGGEGDATAELYP